MYLVTYLKKAMIYIIVILFTYSCSKNNTPITPEPEEITNQNLSGYKQKVLLVGLDGVDYEQLQEANTPHLDSLFNTKAFTGGIEGTATAQFTFSGPGWMSILTGTWIDQHGVPGNANFYRDKAKTAFSYIKENKQNTYLASIVNWNTLYDFQEDQLNNMDYRTYVNPATTENSERVITDSAIKQIIRFGPDFIFAMYTGADDVGHLNGFGEAYTTMIEKLDTEFGRLREAIAYREKEFDESWLIIVVTDHGRIYPDGRNHGGTTTSEKTIFIKMNQPGNNVFTFFNADVPDQDHEGLYGYPAQTSVTPTILRHLKIPVQDEWSLGSAPLTGEDGPMNVMFGDRDQEKLYWYSTSTGDADIFKNGIKIATVPASQGTYTDIDNSIEPIDGKINYTISISHSTGTMSKEL